MYSIFSTQSKKHNYLKEGEPPPKKLVREEDILIKKLSENQLKTSITLSEQLHNKKEFTSSESFTNITSFVSGKTELKDFQAKVVNVDEVNYLKSKGLNDKDIEIYRDFTNLGSEFWVKYKNVNEDILYKHINGIKKVTSMGSSNDSESVPPTSGHQEKCLNSLNLQTSETKLFKFVAQNKFKKEYLPGPMDELPGLEKQVMQDLEEYSSCDIKKIRKKARSMGNKIKNLGTVQNIVHLSDCGRSIKNNNSQRQTLWDVKEKPTYREKKVEIIDKDKVYSCKPQNWYTVKDGNIIKLDKNKDIPTNLVKPQNCTEKFKLTLEEVKNIPKFVNYDPGVPSKVLYVKNLGKNVGESCLKDLLRQSEEQCYSVKLMSGKMKGQAFIEFQDSTQASNALEVLNGVVLEGKPIIVQFGRR